MRIKKNGKVINLTESDLHRIVKRVIKETQKHKTEEINELFFKDEEIEDSEPDYYYQVGNKRGKDGDYWRNITSKGDRTWDINYGIGDEDWEEFEDEELSKKFPKSKFRRGYRK